jgi:hypothetical protein
MVASDDHGRGTVAAADLGSAGGTPGSAGGTPGSAVTSPAGSNTPAAGSVGGSAEVHAGSDGARTGSEAGSGGKEVAVDALSEIEVTSTPAGAQIFVDGVDTGKVTPSTLSIPNKPGMKPISITLRRKGYHDFTFKDVDASKDSQQPADLVKAGSGTGRRIKGSGNKRGGGGQGSADPDGLMPP